MLYLLCIPLEYPLESRGQLTTSITDLYPRSQGSVAKSSELKHYLKGFATFWEFSFYGQKKFADYEYHSLFAEKVHFHT